MKKPVLTIVVPCFNEQEVLHETARQLSDVLDELIINLLISSNSKILFVDDGSKDHTWELILKESQFNQYVKGLKLGKNVGHQKALLAGLETAMHQSDCVISIDADLQDDVGVIRKFIGRFLDGYDIVYGVRDSRDTDTFFKRTTALGFYRLMERIGIKLIPNHADFRLMSKRALKELFKYKETNLFLRGLIPLLGFKSTIVYYDRKERFAGKSKYPIKKMLAFAFDGITSFSVSPIRLVTLIGFVSIILSVAAGGYSFIQAILGNTKTGWTSLMISIWFVGGLQLMGIGIIGEYIGKIFQEVKNRPRYSIENDTYSSIKAEKNYKEAELNDFIGKIHNEIKKRPKYAINGDLLSMKEPIFRKAVLKRGK